MLNSLDSIPDSVAALICMAGILTSLACYQRPPADGPADMVLYNSQLRVLDSNASTTNSVALVDGNILATGSRSELEEWIGPQTRLVDLQGGTVIPSLKDHHLHLLDIGFSVLNRKKSGALFLDLTGATSPEEVAKRVADRASTVAPGTWILGKGWNQGAWGTGTLPDHHILDRAAPDHPVFLARGDGHCGWVNQNALTLAGIAAGSPDPAGGQALRKADGSPTGVLLERANEPVLALIPEPDDATVMEAFREGAQAVAAQGITDIYDAGFLAFPGVVGMNIRMERYLDLLKQADRKAPLPININLMIPSPSNLADRLIQEPAARQISDRIKITHIKLFTDGALGSRGAALREPYSDDPSTTGVPRMSVDELEADVHRTLLAGLDVATHAIGDRAIGETLEVYEGLLTKMPDLDPRRLRIDHFSYGTPEDIQKAAELGILLVVQPGFIYPDDEGFTMEDHRLGPERKAGAYAFGTLARLGGLLVGSSDDFTIPPHPLWNFYAAVTRMNPNGKPEGGWHPVEKLERNEALELFTRFQPPG
ncbi:MAG: amidohydrolase, partial [Acidobacteriota bacterium]